MNRKRKKGHTSREKECDFFYGKREKDKPGGYRKDEPGRADEYEIAQELGLLDQVLEEGWKTLSAKETGRIGGIMNRRRKQKEKEGGISQEKEQ